MLKYRETLNKKIEICLELFEAINDRAADEKSVLYKFYDETKLNIIKILNEIVENYSFIDSTKPSYEGNLNLELEENARLSKIKEDELINKIRLLEEEKEEDQYRIEELEEEVIKYKQMMLNPKKSDKNISNENYLMKNDNGDRKKQRKEYF